MNTAPLLDSARLIRGSSKSSQSVLRSNVANELIFAVVGHVGSGTSEVCNFLKTELERKNLPGGPYTVHILKASEVIRAWAAATGREAPAKSKPLLLHATELQNLGDSMRQGGDHAAVAKKLIGEIQKARGSTPDAPTSANADGDAPLDGTRRAYILDSIRHPAEVFLLRTLYQAAFALVGVVCDEDTRLQRLNSKFADAGDAGARRFMDRDNRAKEPHGQRVEGAFHLADYFIDNSVPRQKAGGKPNTEWKVSEHLSRLIKIVLHVEIIRPRSSETAMYVASGAERRSACLSRQVGAALLDRNGNVIATGTNEVPRAGGGVYGQGFEEGASEKEGAPDDRCFQSRKTCSNTAEQNVIINDLITLLASVPGMEEIVRTQQQVLVDKLRESRISELLEFSRAVHAEMDALLSAARKGISAVGTRMFVTTFPCHYCARHIVTAGVDEVQYIEAYPKSRALTLHDDSIATQLAGWNPPSSADRGLTVLFRPFTGVAPRLYARAFLKDRDLKDKITGKLLVGEPAWGRTVGSR